MVLCEHCGNTIDHMPFKCKYCTKKLCRKCRIPENHNCIALPKTEIITSIEMVDQEKEYEKLINWISPPIKIFCLTFLIYFVGAMYFFTMRTTPGYIVGGVFTILCLFLLMPLYTYIGIYFDFRDRMNFLSIDFIGAWKDCGYIGSVLPEDCRSCGRDDCWIV